MKTFKEIVYYASSREASDLHMTVGLPPVYRIDGELVNEGDIPLTNEDVVAAMKQLANEDQQAELEKVGEIDFAVTFDGTIRMRCNAFYQQGNVALALRLLPLKVPTVQSLGLAPIIVEQAEKPRGLVLLTGPTGSGKSSTLAALLDHINHTRRRHIITLENPIEFLYKHDKCIINQREVGDDTDSFAAGLRAALRQDPDVILVGEMRDLETISTAITAAETGHLVISTLHTVGAANTIDRIVDVFPANAQQQIRVQLSTVLQAVVSQQLLPTTDGKLTPAFEIMFLNNAIRNMIRENKIHQIDNVISMSMSEGMVSMNNSLLALLRAVLIDKETCITNSPDPEQMRMRLV